MKPNRLTDEKSPYLLQHARNPVDWWPWTEAAFDHSRRTDKPIFLSIGYATCHWCHVMEKESFEDPATAKLLNDTFVCIKVDREERPDIDAVYMTACQLLSGSGGWPLSIIMTPDKKPFFAATYIPRSARFGRVGLQELCPQIQQLWQEQRGKATDAAQTVTQHLQQAFASTSGGEEPDQAVLDEARRQLTRAYDETYGGFDQAPKFPTPHRLLFLLRCYRHRPNEYQQLLAMVKHTLIAMRLGGMWDHVGFGFHRYSTDKQWLLPHFEKMLYDQALLALAYLEAYQVSSKRLFKQTSEEIFTYVTDRMQSPQGAFWAAEDADSEGEEGRFYVWHWDEWQRLLGKEQAHKWSSVFNLAPEGNFVDEATGQKTGANILHLSHPLDAGLVPEWEDVRRRLYQTRDTREHPLRDDKVLTDWNGLMIAALARGARILQNQNYVDAARAAVNFIQQHMYQPNGRLWHRYRQGEAAITATANDYAYLIWGLIELYQATFDPRLIEEALSLQQIMLTDFWDPHHHGFYLTANAIQELPARPKEIYDGALPSANSVALNNLLWLFKITGDSAWEQHARQVAQTFGPQVGKHPAAFTFFLLGMDLALNPGQEIVVSGDIDNHATQAMLAALNSTYAPNQVTLLKSTQNAQRLGRIAGFTDGLAVARGQATAHVCKGFNCQEATTDLNRMLDALGLGNKKGV
jgi:uncharacterized protein YyaL (SSP411 family)